MSGRGWSSEVFTNQFRELQATSLCLSRDGRQGLLASRRHLAILDMEEPGEIARKVARSSRWEVGGAGWNPHAHFSSTIALCCNDKLELYTCTASGDLSQSQSVRGHTRQVTSLHWSCSEPSLLASAGLDGATHVWDIRDPRRPCQTFNTIVGAGHVRWSRDGQFLATAHEGDVKLWDARSPRDETSPGSPGPLSCVSVHMSRVHSVDWSLAHPDTLVTASNDCTVKFHSVTRAKQVQTSSSQPSLSTSVPVWSARHTPFGDGLVTVLVPHFGAHDHSLFLWNNNNLSAPVHTFVGHRDVILDFEWRRVTSGERSGDYQMVTWARDQTLRMWTVDTDVQYRCGVDEDDLESLSASSDTEAEEEAVEAIFINKKDAVSEAVASTPVVQRKDPVLAKITESPVKEHSPESTLENTLQQEFALLETNLNFIQILDRDLDRRTCRVIANTGHSRLLISITFPTSYPVNTAPVFTFLKGSTLIQQNRSKILRMLQDTALTHVKKNRACLEICLRQLEVMLDQFNQEEIADEEATKTTFPFVRTADPHQLTVSQFGLCHETTVPYPRTSGSRFCSNGLLVCFGRPTFQIQVAISEKPDTSQTPRTYSAYLASMGVTSNHSSEQDLLKFGQMTAGNRFSNIQTIHSVASLSVTGAEQNTIKKGRFKVKKVASGAQEDGFLKMRRVNSKPKPRLHPPPPASRPLKVTVYNISAMLPVRRDLAARYIVTSDPLVMCEHNAEVAAEAGAVHLAQVWQVVAQVVSAAKTMEEISDAAPWSRCPFGAPLIASLIQHHLQCQDFQTLAMLVCALTMQTRTQKAVIVTAMEPSNAHVEREKFWFLKSNNSGLSSSDSPYHTVHSVHSSTVSPGLRSTGGSDTRLDILPAMKSTRSNSWTEVGQEEAVNTTGGSELETVAHGEIRWGLLDPSLSDLYSAALASYCELLHSWGLMEKRTEVAKHGPGPGLEDVGVASLCPVCGERLGGRRCEAGCGQVWALTCVLCRVPVTGLSLLCPGCGHGGHHPCITNWFSKHEICSADCSCQCKMYYCGQ